MKEESTTVPDPSSERLLDSIEDEYHRDDYPLSQKQRACWCPTSLLSTQTIAALIIVALLVTILEQSIQLSTNSTTLPISMKLNRSSGCGTNVDEAIAHGCVFDYMNFSWQPPECYYPDLDEKYAAMMREDGPMRWWADADLTEPIPDDRDVLKMYYQVWTERRFHYKHCLYGWDLLHFSYDNRVPLPDLMTRNHSRHCAHVLDKAIKHDDGKELSIEHAVTWFSGCVWPRA